MGDAPGRLQPELDRQVRAGGLGFTRLRALRRDERATAGARSRSTQVWSARYDRLLYTAHGVVVAEYVATP